MKELLEQHEDPKGQFGKFSEMLELPQFCEHMETDFVYKEVVLELLFLSFRFAVDKQWSAAQVSAFTSLVKTCILKSFFAQDGEQLTMQESYREFSNLVKTHAVPHPPSSEEVFSLTQVVEIIDQVSTSFFKHYRSYKRTFSKKCPMEFTTVKMKFVVPQPPTVVSTLREKESKNDESETMSQIQVEGQS